jgi:hypothetical protein
MKQKTHGEDRARVSKIPIASATRLSRGYAITLVSSWTRGFPPSGCPEFGFIGKYV